MPKKITTVAKKVTTKAPKKVSTKSSTQKVPKVLVYAPNDKSFWLADGQVLNSLLALKGALAEIDKTIFAHHVSNTKNDFADWVEQVLDDADCAKALRKAKTGKGAHTVVVRHLKFYQL